MQRLNARFSGTCAAVMVGQGGVRKEISIRTESVALINSEKRSYRGGGGGKEQGSSSGCSLFSFNPYTEVWFTRKLRLTSRLVVRKVLTGGHISVSEYNDVTLVFRGIHWGSGARAYRLRLTVSLVLFKTAERAIAATQLSS